jgi:hypothetical protein
MMRMKLRAALATALALLAAAPACSGRKGAAGLVRSSALGTYPRESAALLVMEVKKIRMLHPDTPWLKNMAALSGREGGAVAEIMHRLGPDVLARLDRLSLAVVPRPDHTIAYAVLAEGTFDGAKVREALGGDNLLTMVEVSKMDFSVVVLKDGSVALGPKSVLETMLANDASRGHGLDESPAILTPLEDVRQEAQFWGALDCRSLQRLFKEAPGPTDLSGLTLNAAPVQSLVSIAFRGMVGDTLDIVLFGRADAEANARTLADAARGLVALGRVGASRDEAREWLELLDGIHISQSGPGVVLRASIPAKTMESFVAPMIASRPTAREAQAPAPAAGASPGPQQPAGRPDVVAPAAPGPAAPQAKAAPRKPVESSRKAAPPAGSAPPADSPSRPAPEPQDTRTPSDGAP